VNQCAFAAGTAVRLSSGGDETIGTVMDPWTLCASEMAALAESPCVVNFPHKSPCGDGIAGADCQCNHYLYAPEALTPAPRKCTWPEAAGLISLAENGNMCVVATANGGRSRAICSPGVVDPAKYVKQRVAAGTAEMITQRGFNIQQVHASANHVCVLWGSKRVECFGCAGADPTVGNACQVPSAFKARGSTFALSTSKIDDATCAIDVNRGHTCWGAGGAVVFDIAPIGRADTVAVFDTAFACTSHATTVICSNISGANRRDYDFSSSDAAAPFTQMAVGGSHVCIIDARSKLHCYVRGRDEFAVPSALDAVQVRAVAVGDNSVCVILRKYTGVVPPFSSDQRSFYHFYSQFLMNPGSLYCWGPSAPSNNFFRAVQSEQGEFYAIASNSAGEWCGVSASGKISCLGSTATVPLIDDSLRVGAQSCMLSVATPSTTAAATPARSAAPFIGKCPGGKPCRRVRASPSSEPMISWSAIGSYAMSSAPAVSASTRQMSCEHKCRELHREVSTRAVVTCSTRENVVDYKAWVNRFGSEECHIAGATDGDVGGLFNTFWYSLSAYVYDAPDCFGKINYCFANAQ